MIHYYKITDATVWPELRAWVAAPDNHAHLISTGEDQLVAVGSLRWLDDPYNPNFLARFGHQVQQFDPTA